MSKFSERFFAGTTPPLRWGCLGFLIALIGVTLGFSIDYRLGNPWAYLAFSLVAIGIGIGWISIAWGWFEGFRAVYRWVRYGPPPSPPPQPPKPRDPKVPLSGPGGL